MANEKLDTNQKAQRINLDANRYGTFAEIGAGQEVVRWFFRAGGAASTVAKTISAYDMAVSDAIYGPTDYYVSLRQHRGDPPRGRPGLAGDSVPGRIGRRSF